MAAQPGWHEGCRLASCPLGEDNAFIVVVLCRILTGFAGIDDDLILE